MITEERRKRGEIIRAKALLRKPEDALECPGCHLPFWPMRVNQKYCKRLCMKNKVRRDFVARHGRNWSQQSKPITTEQRNIANERHRFRRWMWKQHDLQRKGQTYNGYMEGLTIIRFIDLIDPEFVICMPGQRKYREKLSQPEVQNSR